MVGDRICKQTNCDTRRFFMKIVILDADTLGGDVSFEKFEKINGVSSVVKYDTTPPELVAERIADCDVIILNKVKLGEANLCCAANLKLICITATGYDNVDTAYCGAHGIAVCNVVGYSSHSVAQVTAAAVLGLANHIGKYDRYVKDGSYTRGGVQNHLTPVYHELCGMTWGIIGLGGIGKEVAAIAKALGCRVIGFKRKPIDGFECVPLDRLMRESDIITIHLPLSDETRGIVSRDMLSLAKKNAIIFNAARGAVWDEAAAADAVLSGSIAALGADVYSEEPFGEGHPFTKLLSLDNVCLLPHMSWGAYESRVRCLDEIVLNIKAFFDGKIRCRVDI